jgi:chromate transporter
MGRILLNMIMLFAPLSAMSFGGGQTVIADIAHQSVNVFHWLTDRQFADLFALSRVSPGPTTLISSLIGWHVAGFVGLMVATLAMYLPSSTIFVAVTSFWHKHQHAPWRRAVERGLAPVAVGLILAGAVAVLQAMHATAIGWATTAVTTLVVQFVKINPYVLMSAVAAIYIAVFYAGLY